MNLDELRSVRTREREAASLGDLRPTFYEDVGSFIAELKRERDRAAERADDPFASSEVRRLTDDIEAAESTVEAIYDRRVGKVVEMASLAAAGMSTDEGNLTNEERALFENLVDRIADNRARVLEGVLEGEGSELSCSRDPDPDALADREPADAVSGTAPGTDADADASGDPETDANAPADAFMGGGPSGGTDFDPGPELERAEPSPDPPRERESEPPVAAAAGADRDRVERSLVRITSDVGEIFGVDDRAYQLSADEVVTLPEANAGPLVERGAAERLE